MIFRSILAVFLVLPCLGGGGRARAAVPGVPPPGLQSDPAAAADDSLLYAVWTDGRLGGAGRLFWTRFAEPVSDTLAQPLTEGGASELRSAVGAGPDWALIVWEAWTSAGTCIRAAEVSRTEPPGLRSASGLTADPGPVWRPAAAVSGQTGVLIWEDERDAPGDLYYGRWDRGAGPRDPGGIPFATGPEEERWARVAAAPSGGFVAVWSRSAGGAGYEVVARALDAGGEPFGPVRAVSGLEPFAPVPDVACGGGGCLAAWRVDGAGGGDLAGRFLTPSGEPAGAGPFPLAGGPGMEFLPRLAPDGTGYALTWLVQDAAGRALRRARVDSSGQAIPPGGVVLGSGETFCADPALAAWSGRAVAVWRVPLPEDDDDLLMAGFDPADGDPVDPLPLTLWAGSVGVGAPPPPVRLRAFPNPFGDRVRLDLAEAGEAGPVDIFDVRGRLVRRLHPAGGSVTWDGRDAAGVPAVPGIYFARVGGSEAGLRLVRMP